VHTEASTGSRLPRFVKDEFDAFLQCGILAHGFLRLRCGECGHDSLLTFSCKRRGFCPSCGARLMKILMRRVVLVEDTGRSWLTEADADGEEARTLRPLQAAAVTYRIAFGPRAGQKVLTLRGAMPRDVAARQPLCADIDGFSLHAAVRIEAHERKRLERLCRYITRPALSDERAAEPESEARIARRERPQADRRHGPVREAGRLRAVQPPWIRPAACAGPG